MKKLLSAAAALLLCAVFIFSAAAANIKDTVMENVNGILDMKMDHAGSTSVGDWINGELTENAGESAEWYIIALSQSGDYDFSSYEAALTEYLKNNTVRSASARLKYALALLAVGSDSSYISDTLNDSVSEQGIMSLVYGLHIMNNGYTCEKYSAADVIETILSQRHEDGGWSITGAYGDVDVTAMTIQALAPHYDSDPDVSEAVNGALTFLSSRQLDDGGYSSYGVGNPESAAQVLTALSSLGIDCTTDERFIKNGSTVIDGILKYRLSDGGFCHVEGGDANDTATVQALYSMIAYIRMTEGKSPLYIFDSAGVKKTPIPSDTDSDGTTEGDPSAVTARDDDTGADSDKDTIVTSEKGSYKPWACLVIVVTGGAVCLVLFILGKRSFKNFIAVILIAAAAVVLVAVTDIQSASDFYTGGTTEKENAIGTVTLTIRCDTVAGKSDSEYIPADGVILDVTEFVIAEGDTVYGILTEAARKYGIRVESKGGRDMAYVEGINYLYELDFGDLSGWVYHVNGVSPQIGCGEYKLAPGDVIEWLYTCDLGEDVK